jgi:hypothetical protein
MINYFRAKIASRRLRREFKECQVIVHEVNQKLIDRRAHREQRRPSTVAVSSEQEDANEADIEEEEEEEEEEDIYIYTH